jgi:FkbM family methyltransferase
MNKVAANIVKGMVGRLRGRQRAGSGAQLGWLQEKILKHQDDQTVKSYTFKNFKVAYKRPYELLHTYREIFEKEIYRFSAPVNNPLIIDVGANIGMSMLYFKQLYPAAQLMVFEPDENNFQLLSQNCQQNGLQNVQLHKAAVWIHNGTISFEAKESEASHIEEVTEDGANQVACVRLADILQAQKKIHFLKMDIEGAEYKVVQDAAPQLHKVDNFFLEYHGKADETYKLADLFVILKAAGFAMYIKNAADNLEHPFVQKSTGTIYDVQLNIFCYRNA